MFAVAMEYPARAMVQEFGEVEFVAEVLEPAVQAVQEGLPRLVE